MKWRYVHLERTNDNLFSQLRKTIETGLDFNNEKLGTKKLVYFQPFALYIDIWRRDVLSMVIRKISLLNDGFLILKGPANEVSSKNWNEIAFYTLAAPRSALWKFFALSLRASTVGREKLSIFKAWGNFSAHFYFYFHLNSEKWSKITPWVPINVSLFFTRNVASDVW